MNPRLLGRGTVEHYEDAPLYDHEYRRRRTDVRFYRRIARQVGGPILELGCGTGRIALPLARDGHALVGVDLSRAMLTRARRRAERLPAAARDRLRLVQGDILALPLEGRFQLVVCAFNTLQHVYRAEALVDLLRGVRERLRPDGRFVFDVLNPDLAWLTRDPQRRWARTRFKHPSSGRPLVYTTNHTYDPVTQIVLVNIYYDPPPGEAGASHVVRLAHRQYFPQELRMLVEVAGFRVERCFGGFDGEPLDGDSESQVLVCAPAEPQQSRTPHARSTAR
ncbi:MAG: class I SAM-dependent methyltransferase [Deltaproteobacteria bacterium]|nr:class I SAM-dependent methyltransferase [Deltaproteobacteria bacterium]